MLFWGSKPQRQHKKWDRKTKKKNHNSNLPSKVDLNCCHRNNNIGSKVSNIEFTRCKKKTLLFSDPNLSSALYLHKKNSPFFLPSIISQSMVQKGIQKGIHGLLKTAARVYLRRIEVRGASHVPSVPAIYAGNHPSGLIDPLAVMAALPEKQFCSVAKSSLFETPLVSFLVKSMEAIPVAKVGDAELKVEISSEERKALNDQMFSIARNRLNDGKNIVIFPEGTTHSTPTIKSLKIGTAKMAFEVAMNGGPRIPIVPLGLSYSTPSGNEFRGSVLVDVGRAITLTDEMVAEYEAGDRSIRYSLCHRLTNIIEGRLRDCTIRVPNWLVQLENLCEVKKLAPPDFVRVEEGAVFRMDCVVDGRRYSSEGAPIDSRNEGDQLKLSAAKKAFFEINGAHNGLSEIVDRDFVEMMHLARRIYKPHNVSLELAQYASLTRNFMRIALKNANDEKFIALWSELSDYKNSLAQLKVTDKYVSAHAKGSDPLNERLNILRYGAKKDVALLFFGGPMSLIGTIVHAPVIAAAWHAGRSLGTDKEGDISVVATVRLLAAFVGCVVGYPSAAAGVGAIFGLKAAVATIPALSLSAYAAINFPVSSAINLAKGSFTLLTEKDSVDKLRDQRSILQAGIREWADDHAPAEMVGWWKDPLAGVAKIRQQQRIFEDSLMERDRIVKLASLHRANLKTISIKLTDKHKRQENERAVLTFKQAADSTNDNAILWLPGRNDSFFHVHVLHKFLNAGFDVFALDLRRCGRAKIGDDGEPSICDELLAHDSYDFREYHYEMDATLKFLKNPSNLTDSIEGGCGRVYSNIVVYAHSTGALIAGEYGMDGAWRGAVDGYVFNSPFWSWHLPKLQKAAVENAYRGLADDVLIDKGGGVSEYSTNMKRTYHFSDTLKSTKTLATSVGWCKAVTKAQQRLKSGKMVLGKPTLVLSTPADTVLDFDKIDKYNDFLLKERKDGKYNKVDGPDLLVERQIEGSSHDVLAADSAQKVDEAMNHIETFLVAKFDADWK